MYVFHGVTRVAILTIAAFAIVACSEEAPVEKTERIRAIKPYYVIEPAGGSIRHYSGSIKASNTSSLSFAVAGTVKTVTVSQGDQVAKGQVLATLDTKPLAFNVQVSKAQQATAQTDLTTKKADLGRKQALFKKGWVTKAANDDARNAFEAAKEQLNLSRSQLGLAERDLAKTVLKAPFDGVIALRDVDPFVEIALGKTVFQLDSKGAYKVELEVPDTIVGQISIGAPVTVDVRAVEGCGCTARVTEIGVVSGAANAVTVTATIIEAPDGLLPGAAADASIAFAKHDEGNLGFLVPLVAIAPGDGTARGFVFKFDAKTGAVKKIAIHGAGATGNLIASHKASRQAISSPPPG
ncbi:MAG: efflux RND transporter periplasmic adaptor subunit [Alphaproteobacteria bacterium]|nr:efflux RND transporter periplasmic adaptor subunit [Alphaproteobacteria bacterium]